MGQYYYPINIDEKEYLYSHDYDAGLKLMEHSWVGNSFVGTVEKLLREGGRWYKDRIVWAGDYMDEDIFVPEEVEEKNKISLCNYIVNKVGEKIQPENVGETVKNWPPQKDNVIDIGRYIINHTRREYVDKNKVPSDIDEFQEKRIEWKVHPLPLLTCSGNGRGGGDYYPVDGHDKKHVGYWAGDRISIEDSTPKNYKTIKPKFRERRLM